MRAYSYSLLQAVPEDLGKHANNQALSHFFVSACSVFFHRTEVSFPEL